MVSKHLAWCPLQLYLQSSCVTSVYAARRAGDSSYRMGSSLEVWANVGFKICFCVTVKCNLRLGSAWWIRGGRRFFLDSPHTYTRGTLTFSDTPSPLLTCVKATSAVSLGLCTHIIRKQVLKTWLFTKRYTPGKPNLRKDTLFCKR